MPFRFLSTMLIMLALTSGSQAADTLQFSNAWIRATAPNAQVAGAFLRIENTGSKPDRLLSASTDIAERVEIHEMKMSGDVMQMREITDGLAVPAGQTLALKPGSYHLMLIAPKQPLLEGQKINIELMFETAGRKSVVFEVHRQAPGMNSP